MLNTDKNLKLYYSISEVAAMFDVNESLLRFWEKEFPQLNPKKGGRGIRQYRKEDIETVKLIYHLVKERGIHTLEHLIPIYLGAIKLRTIDAGKTIKKLRYATLKS